jgi:hypothetical protein
MKKIILDFSNTLLTREQMKGIKGAYGSSGGSGQYTCTAQCAGVETVTCSSNVGCWARDTTSSSLGYVACGSYPNEEYTPCNM